MTTLTKVTYKNHNLTSGNVRLHISHASSLIFKCELISKHVKIKHVSWTFSYEWQFQQMSSNWTFSCSNPWLSFFLYTWIRFSTCGSEKLTGLKWFTPGFVFVSASFAQSSSQRTAQYVPNYFKVHSVFFTVSENWSDLQVDLSRRTLKRCLSAISNI